MPFPMVQELLSQLFKKPNTNPFPAAQLPPTITGLLAQVGRGEATLNPPVPVPAKLRGKMTYNRDTCIGCKLCIKVCPAHAIDFLPATKKSASSSPNASNADNAPKSAPSSASPSARSSSTPPTTATTPPSSSTD
jgi:NAD-dependent dihydropyrimidine dehydrogenase PreA subunit